MGFEEIELKIMLDNTREGRLQGNLLGDFCHLRRRSYLGDILPREHALSVYLAIFDGPSVDDYTSTSLI
jgi:hypothetical protein